MIIGVIISFLFSLGSFLGILFFLDPNQNFLFVLLFYSTLFFSLFGFFILLNLLLKNKRINSIRQSLLLSAILIISLILENLKIFNWINALMLLIIIFAFEWRFYNKNKKYK